MDFNATQPRLRLVGSRDPKVTATWRAARDVAAANRAASRNTELDPTDPRWVLAARTHTQLQGSTLTPERRDRLLTTARQLGVRPFEANVIIAIVQDHARRGESLSTAADTLKMLRDPRAERKSHPAWPRWVAAGITAFAANALLIWWLISA